MQANIHSVCTLYSVYVCVHAYLSALECMHTYTHTRTHIFYAHTHTLVYTSVYISKCIRKNAGESLLCIVVVHKRAENVAVTVALKEENIFYTNRSGSNHCGYHDGFLNQSYTLISCIPPITGQFVQIQSFTTSYLNLYEVEVHGT